MKGTLKQVRINEFERNCKLTFEFDYDFDDAVSIANELYGKKVDIKVKKQSDHRSLDSNKLLWATYNEMALKLHQPPKAIHEEMVKRYAPCLEMPFREDVNPEPFFDYCEFITESEVNGKKAKWWRVYQGTHKMEQDEFNEFLNYVLQEAHELGIVSASEAEILGGKNG